MAKVPEGERVYAIGDIHGRNDLLARLHEQIAAEVAAAPGVRATVVHVGDYVDRGPDCFGVVDRLAGDRPVAGAAHVCLKGNHEDLMLGFLDGEVAAPDWLANGGDATLRSYGVAIPRLRWDRFAPAEASQDAGRWRAELRDRLPERHGEFLAGLELCHRIGGYVFVHAGVRPGVALDRQDPEDLMWIRETFLGSTRDHGAVVVHGHTIVEAVEMHPNRIAIDTGAWRSDRLSCLVLEGADRRVLHT